MQGMEIAPVLPERFHPFQVCFQFPFFKRTASFDSDFGRGGKGHGEIALVIVQGHSPERTQKISKIHIYRRGLPAVETDFKAHPISAGVESKSPDNGRSLDPEYCVPGETPFTGGGFENLARRSVRIS